MKLNELADSSRVWIYQSQRVLSADEQQAIQPQLDAFMAQWAAHGKQLFGAATILDDYFIVLAADEAMTSASGCSIDTSVRFIRDLGAAFDLQLFDRLHVLTEKDGQKEIVHFSDLKNHPDAIVYNPMIQNLGALRQNWKVKVADSGLI